MILGMSENVRKTKNDMLEGLKPNCPAFNKLVSNQQSDSLCEPDSIIVSSGPSLHKETDRTTWDNQLGFALNIAAK